METIVGLATPPIKGALGVIRVSGDDCLNLVKSCFSKEIQDKGNSVFVGNFLSIEKEIIDEVVLTYFKAPKSFTGENVIEISFHGSMLIASMILQTLIAKGARMAERGEFSSRAFYHGKIDLVQAEAILSLIDAKTEEQRKLSIFSLKGKTSKLLVPVKESLGDILSNIEVNIDYPEYDDIEIMTREKLDVEVNKIINQLNSMINDAKHGNVILEGINVVLIGKPNVGKSSLLNALLGQNKAIVTSIPGTTRDLVEGEINLDGLILHIIDTAGIHKSDDIIETIGIEKSLEAIKKADLIIHIKDPFDVDSSNEILNYIKDKNYIEVYNKADLKKFDNKVCISAKNNDIDNLIMEIKKLYNINDFIKPSLCSEREIGLLVEARENLKQALEKNQYEPLDLISIDLKQAYDNLKRILGEEVSPDMEKEVFSRFCVGK